jgi:hypothetical protein
MLPLYQRRQRAQARAKVLQAVTRHGFTDGVQQISFNVEKLGAEHWLKGWFKGLDGITYRFEWRGSSLTYQQTTSAQPLLTHSLTVPNPRKLTKRLSTDQKAQHVANIRDRATFSCGLGRSPRNRQCQISGVAIGRELKTLVGLFS